MPVKPGPRRLLHHRHEHLAELPRLQGVAVTLALRQKRGEKCGDGRRLNLLHRRFEGTDGLIITAEEKKDLGLRERGAGMKRLQCKSALRFFERFIDSILHAEQRRRLERDPMMI